MFDKDEMRRKVMEAVAEAKKNPELQAAIKNLQEETKKYSEAAKQIEEIQILQEFVKIAKEAQAVLVGEIED